MSHIIQITTFFHPVEGGVEQQVLDLSRELIKQGHKVTIFCSDSTRSKKRITTKQETIRINSDISSRPGAKSQEPKAINIKRFKTWFSFSEFYKVYPQLFWELMKTDFDIVHVHGFRKFEIYPALLAAKLKRKRIIVTTHNPFYTTSRSKLLQLFVNLHDFTFGKLFTRFIDKVIALTQAEIPFIEEFNVKKENIRVIPNGLTKGFFEKQDPNKFIKDYKIPVKELRYIALWIGRLNKVKGLENLETAIKQLTDTLFIFIGPDDNASKEYKNLYKDLPNVVFTGPVKHSLIKHALGAAHIFVLPSLHEAFGVVLLEAMSQGLPIVSTNVGGPAEIIKDNFGIIQDPKDQWAWMLNIEKILKNKKLRKQMRINARKEAEKYKWGNLIYQILEVYGV
jgi:glycosyltransferase involved in cell wall biosynthesis